MIDSLDLSGLEPTAYLDSRVGPASRGTARPQRTSPGAISGTAEHSTAFPHGKASRGRVTLAVHDSHLSDSIKANRTGTRAEVIEPPAIPLPPPPKTAKGYRSFVSSGTARGGQHSSRGTTRARNCLPLQC